MKIVGVTLVAVLMSGCGQESYRIADEKILCDPQSGEAYLVEHNVGDTSFVKRMESTDGLCDDY